MRIGDMAKGKMMAARLMGTFAICAAVATFPGTAGGYLARADDLATGLYSGVNQLRPNCGAISDDVRLTAAAQRHADDMLRTGTFGHTGSDGSSPRARIAQAGYGRTGSTGEIVYRGTGSAATASAPLAFWMNSPAHRAIILNCAFNTGGFATAWNGNMMTAVVDFVGS